MPDETDNESPLIKHFEQYLGVAALVFLYLMVFKYPLWQSLGVTLGGLTFVSALRLVVEIVSRKYPRL